MIMMPNCVFGVRRRMRAKLNKRTRMVDSTGNILTGSQSRQLIAIRNAQRAIDRVQNVLASGLDVASALDNPQNFFQAQSLSNRASDLSRLLDGIQGSIRTVQEADHGIEAIQKLLNNAEALIDEAEVELYSEEYIPDPNVLPDDVSAFSSYIPSQDGAGTFELQNDGNDFYLEGNLWKQLAGPFEITADTVLRFEYRSTAIPEISAIGFDDDADFSTNDERFFLYGTQVGSVVPFAAPESTFRYSGSGEFETIEIRLGDYFTGTFSNMTFIHDHDIGVPGNATFRNITLFEAPLGDQALNPELYDRSDAYEADYLNLLEQIDYITKDASYRGINLLRGETLITDFNEDRDNTLASDGIDATALGLGLTQDNFRSLGRLQEAREQVRSARETLRTYNRTLASDLNIIKTRQTFTRETINHLKAGADDLTVSDQNRAGAELLALQTRQAIQFSILSFANVTIGQLL